MKKLLSILFIGLFGFAGVAFALPYFSSTQTVVPFQNNTYDLGTSTAAWRKIYTNDIVISGTCTGCSAGSQTPWGQAIDGAGYAFTNGGQFTLTNILATSTTASSTFPILHSTYASTTQLDVTGTATTTFGGSISLGHPYFVTTHGLRGDASDGLYVTSNNYTAVANFGVGNTSNSVFSGSVNVTGNLGVLTGSTLTVADLTSAITLTNGSGVFAEYTGTSCTNQFVRSLSALGVATCASVANTDLTNSSLTVTAGTGLGGGGSVALGSTVTLTNPYYIATTSPTLGQLAYFTGVTPTSIGSIATTTMTLPSYITYSGTLGKLVGGADGTFAISQLPIANGGTNATSFGTSDGIVAYNGTSLVNFSGYTLTSGLLTAPNASTTNLTAGTYLQIPNSDTQTLSTGAGSIGIDTTNGEFLFSTGRETVPLTATRTIAYAFSTTTTTGSTTVPFPLPASTAVITRLRCHTYDTGTGRVDWYNGTASTSLNCSTTAAQTWLTSNNSVSTTTTTARWGFGTLSAASVAVMVEVDYKLSQN